MAALAAELPSAGAFSAATAEVSPDALDAKRSTQPLAYTASTFDAPVESVCV